MEMEFSIYEDFNDYILKYIMVTKSENDDKCDILIHKDSKFLFYNFNGYLSRINRPLQLVRQTTIAHDNYALNVLQGQG